MLGTPLEARACPCGGQLCHLGVGNGRGVCLLAGRKVCGHYMLVGGNGGARTCMARLGTGRVVHAGVACLANFLAMEEPRGTDGAGACRGGGVVSLVEEVRTYRPPPRLRPRAGDRPP